MKVIALVGIGHIKRQSTVCLSHWWLATTLSAFSCLCKFLYGKNPIEGVCVMCCVSCYKFVLSLPYSSHTCIAMYVFSYVSSFFPFAFVHRPLFRDSELFPSMDPHFYQCSRRTTSVEVETVFQRAAKRQAGFNELRIPISCGESVCIHSTTVHIVSYPDCFLASISYIMTSSGGEKGSGTFPMWELFHPRNHRYAIN